MTIGSWWWRWWRPPRQCHLSAARGTRPSAWHRPFRLGWRFIDFALRANDVRIVFDSFFFRPARRSKSTRDQRSESSLSTSRRVNWFASESGRRRRPEICKWECTPVCKWGDAAGMSIRALVSSLKTFLCEEKKSFSICIDCSSTLTRNHFNLVWKQNPTKPLQKWFNEQWNDEKIPQKSLLWFQLERNRVTNRFKPRKTQSTVGGNINDLSWAFAETQLTKPNFFFWKISKWEPIPVEI